VQELEQRLDIVLQNHTFKSRCLRGGVLGTCRKLSCWEWYPSNFCNIFVAKNFGLWTTLLCKLPDRMPVFIVIAPQRAGWTVRDIPTTAPAAPLTRTAHFNLGH